jgi:hypothetical protein
MLAVGRSSDRPSIVGRVSRGGYCCPKNSVLADLYTVQIAEPPLPQYPRQVVLPLLLMLLEKLCATFNGKVI